MRGSNASFYSDKEKDMRIERVAFGLRPTLITISQRYEARTADRNRRLILGPRFVSKGSPHGNSADE